MKGLSAFIDPRTGTRADKMTSSVSRGVIFYTDPPEMLRKKIWTAITGGRETREKQRQLGGNPDLRICSVAGLIAFHTAQDANEYKQICYDCQTGQLLCGDCKARTADFLVEHIRKHQEQRAELESYVRKRVAEIDL